MAKNCEAILILQMDVTSMGSSDRLEYSRRIDEATWNQRRVDDSFRSSIEAAYKMVPFSLRADTSYAEFSEARRNYLEQIKYVEDTRSAYEAFRSYLTSAQIAAWLDCIQDTDWGLKIIEKGATDTLVNLEIVWIHPPGVPDPVREFTATVVGGKSGDAATKPGQLFPPGFKLRQGIHPVTVVLDPDKDLAISVSAAGIGSAQYARKSQRSVSIASATPVGTIITSMLPPSRYADVTGDEVSNERSKWVLADGRDVSGSQYAEKIAGRVPDLRGMFLRGLNLFEPGVPGRTDGYVNPDPHIIRAGDAQMDQFEKHNHELLGANWMQAQVEGGGVFNDGYSQLKKLTTRPPTTETGGEETRPMNVSIYYYIRINA